MVLMEKVKKKQESYGLLYVNCILPGYPVHEMTMLPDEITL